MKKVLIVSTVSRQFYLFEQGNIEVLKSLGYEVHGAANYSDANERLDELDIVRHHFDIQRSPFSLKNIKAFKQLKNIIISENFDAVHCHSPMGGMIARIASKAVGVPTVIYTAHGFHFYRGAPLINWMLYYPVENFLSRYTDVLITINQEDYARAQGFKAEEVVHIPGIGVDTKKFRNSVISRDKKRKELGLSNETVVLLSIGEMIKRKNHETALRALAKLDIHNYVYLICGIGELESSLKDLTKTLGIENKVRFLGFRNDIAEICLASDVFVFPSYQEGLPVSVMESMAAGLPIICSAIRGNTDLVENGKGGYLLEPNDIEGFKVSLEKIIKDTELREAMGKKNYEQINNYSKDVIKEKMLNIYKRIDSL